jgi:HlyD family secretion protein
MFQLGFAAVIVALLAYGFYPKPVAVETAIVRQGELEITVDDDGETRVRERYTVFSPLTGKLLRLHLHPGDRVLRGETELAVIEPTDPSLLDARARSESESRVKAAESSRARALEAQSIADESQAFAQREFQRGETLNLSNSLAKAELDQLEHRVRVTAAEVRMARFLVAIAEHELALAKAALDSTRATTYETMKIQPPIDGVVLKVQREDAGYVAPGTPLAEIGNPTDMELKIDVLSTAATKIRPGNKVIVEHWGGANPLHGTVRLVEPSAFLKISALGVEEKRVNVIIDFDTPWDERPSLGDGFRVEGRIVVDRTAPDSLHVPAGALFREGDQWMVYRVENGRARRCPVQVGLSNGKETEIVKGLALGSHVVVYPSEKVQDGVRVKIAGTSR